MKVQCDVCEKAEAALLCCADEAALCWECDERVHAANKLSGKHQRVPLFTPNSAPVSSSSTAAAAAAAAAQMPICDICQEKAGYFFCLEDRALLCRNCDVGIHTATAHGSSHQRFLITGVRVALQHYLTNNNNNTSTTSSNINNTNNDRNSSSSNNNGINNNHIIPQASNSSITASNSSITDKKPRTMPVSLCVDEGEESLRAQWMWNEVFDSAEFSQCYGISEPGSSS